MGRHNMSIAQCRKDIDKDMEADYTQEELDDMEWYTDSISEEYYKYKFIHKGDEYFIAIHRITGIITKSKM